MCLGSFIIVLSLAATQNFAFSKTYFALFIVFYSHGLSFCSCAFRHGGFASAKPLKKPQTTTSKSKYIRNILENKLLQHSSHASMS